MKTKLIAPLIIVLGLGQLNAVADEVREPPVSVRTVPPVFPDEMRREGRSGVVTVGVSVDEKDNVQEPKVAKTGDEAFAQPAIGALSRLQFKPARPAGAVVATRVSIPIPFTDQG